MRIRDLMTADVVSVTPETSLKDVARLLVEHRISGLPVCDEGARVVGVVSEADILFKERGRAESAGGPLAWLFEDARREEAAKFAARTAGEAMTSPAVTIEPDRPAATAARRMVEQGVNRLPVVSRDGRLLGIVTRADLVRAFTRTDEVIAQEIRDEILRQALWAEPGTIEVTVENGEVQLEGELETSSDVIVLEKLVEKTPGVVSVRMQVGYRVDGHRTGRFAGYR